MRTPEYEVCAEAQKAIQYGLHDVAHRIAQVLKQDAWKRFVTPTGRVVVHDTFASFVVTAQPDGLGTDVETVRRVCRDTTYALDLVDRALQRPVGTNQHEAGNNVPSHVSRPEGNTAAKALRRLRKDRPDLHAEVIAGKKTPNAAAIEAGFRPKTITIPLNPQKAARTLLRHFDAGQIAELLEALKP